MAAHRIIGWALFLIAFAILTSCSSSGSDESDPAMVAVSGRVVDSRGDLVSGATVTIDGVPTAVPTDENGEFSAEVEPGDHELTITKDPDIIAAIPISVPKGGPGELGDIAPTTSYYPWYEDNDADGFGNATAIVNDENQPIGYVINDDDCDDTAAAVYPGAVEVCDGLDNNCNVDIDEGVLLAFYQDGDTDGFGNQSTESLSCSAPAGFVSDSSDCDDANSAVNPGATEICDQLDNNCNVQIDEGVLVLFFEDADNDFYGSATSSVSACTAPLGFVTNSSDCDDSNSAINPLATEACNGVDDNCNAQIDEGTLLIFFEDSDVDGFGNELVSELSCSAPAGFVSDGTDCDDTSGSVFPGAPEVCNEIDDNCNSLFDEGVTTTFFQDADSDQYGNSEQVAEACASPDGYVSNGDDCDDTSADLNPLTEWNIDADSDSYHSDLSSAQQCASPGAAFAPRFALDVFDCDDLNAAVNPGESELFGNGLDDDCDVATPDIAGFQSGELAGEYRTTSITVGDALSGDWIGWEIGNVTLDSAGTISEYETVLSDGTTSNEPPMIYRATLEPSGVLKFLAPIEATGAMSADAESLVVLSPDEGSSFSLSVLQRSGYGSTLQDLQGQWSFRALAVDEADGQGYVYRGSHDVDADGHVATTIGNGETSDPRIYSAFLLDRSGRALKGLDSAQEYTLSGNGNLLIGAYSSDLLAHVFEVGLKNGSDYTSADLAGDWTFNLVTTGSDVTDTAMGYGVLRVYYGGQAEVLFQSSRSPSVRIADGQIAVGLDGTITHADMPSFDGQISADRNTIVATLGESPGPMGLLIGMRRRGPPTVFATDESRRASAAIGFAGGLVETSAADGTIYSLAIPTGALTQDVTVSIAPAENVSGAMPQGTLGAIQFSPDGTILEIPAYLTVQSPGGSQPEALIGFNYQGTGADSYGFQFAYPLADDIVDLDVLHFSGAGIASVDPDTEPDPDAYYNYMIQHIFEVAAVANEGLDSGAGGALCGLFDTWITSLTVRALTAESFNQLNTVTRNIVVMLENLQMAGMVDGGNCSGSCGLEIAALVNAIRDTTRALTTETDMVCKSLTDACVKHELTSDLADQIAISQLWGDMCGFSAIDVSELLSFCDSFVPRFGLALHIDPGESGVVVDDSVRLFATAGSEATVNWTVVGGTDNYATVDPTGLVTGRAVGSAFAEARSTEACTSNVAVVHVHPPIAARWRVVTESRFDIKPQATCQNLELPDPYLVDITTGGSGDSHPGATEINWITGAEYLRPETLSGNLLSNLVELEGTATWEEAGLIPNNVERDCVLTVSVDETGTLVGMSGGCNFRWLGDYVVGTGFDGCWGTDEVSLSPVSAN